MKKIFIFLFFSQILFGYDIYTASKNGNYFAYALKISKRCLLPLKVKDSKGSIDNIKYLLKDKNNSFALVQSDVFNFYYNISPKEMRKIHFHKILPNYQERVYILKNKKMAPFTKVIDFSDKDTIKKLKGIAIGTFGSGTSVTGFIILDKNKITNKIIYLKKEEALDKLLNKEISLLFYVGRDKINKKAKWIEQVLNRYGDFIQLVKLKHTSYPKSNNILPIVPTLLISTDKNSSLNKKVFQCFE